MMCDDRVGCTEWQKFSEALLYDEHLSEHVFDETNLVYIH